MFIIKFCLSCNYQTDTRKATHIIAEPQQDHKFKSTHFVELAVKISIAQYRQEVDSLAEFALDTALQKYQ